MDKGKIILEELNEWIYNDENQAGDKLQIIDASDVPTIIENLVKKLTIPDVVSTFFCGVQGGVCPYETKDRGCKAKFNCENKIAK